MSEPYRCICDPTDAFAPPDPTPRAVEGCPAHRARRAAQLFTEGARALAEARQQCAEPSRGMTYDRLAYDEALTISGPSIVEYTVERPADHWVAVSSAFVSPAGPVCEVEIIVDKPAAQVNARAAERIQAATGVLNIAFYSVGERHTRVTLRPSAAEARSLITSAVYHDVVNGVRQ